MGGLLVDLDQGRVAFRAGWLPICCWLVPDSSQSYQYADTHAQQRRLLYLIVLLPSATSIIFHSSPTITCSVLRLAGRAASIWSDPGSQGGRPCVRACSRSSPANHCHPPSPRGLLQLASRFSYCVVGPPPSTTSLRLSPTSSSCFRLGHSFQPACICHAEYMLYGPARPIWKRGLRNRASPLS